VRGISARLRVFYLFNLAEDPKRADPRFIRVIRVSKIATPVSAVGVHTVFCTPSTDDWTGGITRLQPLTWILYTNRPAQILTT
jgi:hypothetical protein